MPAEGTIGRILVWPAVGQLPADAEACRQRHVDHWSRCALCRRSPARAGLRRGLRLRHARLATIGRSEERRVGKECRSRWAAYHEKKKEEIQLMGDKLSDKHAVAYDYVPFVLHIDNAVVHFTEGRETAAHVRIPSIINASVAACVHGW